MKVSEVREKLNVSTVSQKAGVFTVRKGFFYTNGMDSSKLAERVLAVFPEVEIIDHGEVWKPFRGGASVAQQSHWYVKFSVRQKSV